VAACEEDPATRQALAAGGKVAVTHSDFASMLAEVPCDAVAIGDVYGKRGDLAIRALEAGKHVILDKPICTRLEELERIRALAIRQGLAVGCQLDMRAAPVRQTMRRLIAAGEIGEVQTVMFCGQHPLLPGTRPAWYFEPGCHGGTINDIAIHAVDAIPWITGRQLAAVVAARAWNGKTPQYPHFQDGAQFLLRLDNGGGVMGDVSYFAPDQCGYAAPQYWRFTVHGREGVVEGRIGDKTLSLATHADKAFRTEPVGGPGDVDYVADFLAEVRGETVAQDRLSTAAVVRASRLALQIQAAADAGQFNVSLV